MIRTLTLASIAVACIGCEIIEVLGDDPPFEDDCTDNELGGDFGTTHCPRYYSPSEVENAFSLGISVGQDFQYVDFDILVRVDGSTERSIVVQVNQAHNSKTHGRTVGITIPDTEPRDTEVEVRARIVVSKDYTEPSLCQYNDAYWVEVDGDVVDGRNKGIDDDCYLLYQFP